VIEDRHHLCDPAAVQLCPGAQDLLQQATQAGWPGAPPNSWRKASPAMLLAAATDLHLDLSRSLLVGDRVSDLQAGANAGLPWLAHVLSGHGQQERAAVQHLWAQTREPTGENANCELVLLVAVLGILSGCRSSRDLEAWSSSAGPPMPPSSTCSIRPTCRSSGRYFRPG
jgi:hypothetical protein